MRNTGIVLLLVLLAVSFAQADERPSEDAVVAAVEAHLQNEPARIMIPFDQRTVHGPDSVEVEEMLAEHDRYVRLTTEADDMLDALTEAGLLERHEAEVEVEDAAAAFNDEARVREYYVYEATDEGLEALHPGREPLSLNDSVTLGERRLHEVQEIGAVREQGELTVAEVEVEVQTDNLESWFADNRSAVQDAAQPEQIDAVDEPQVETVLLIRDGEDWVAESVYEAETR